MRTLMAATVLAGVLAACSPAPDNPPAAATPPARTTAPPTSALPPEREPEARPPRSPTPPERVATSETPCRQAIGEAASAKLVQRCIAVSPATRPPCNSANPCDLIQGEIDRSCNQYGPGETRPKECAA